MALDLNVDLANQAASPPPTFSIRTQNKDFSTEPLTSDEADILDTQFNTLVNDFNSRTLSEFYKQRQGMISKTAAYAKNVFDEKMFGGINAADNEIAFDVLRPGHIRAKPGTDNANSSAPTGDTLNNWFFDPGSTGWNDWIGDGTSANDYTFNEDQVTLVLGVVDQDPTSPISGVNVQRFGRNVDMIPKDLNDSRVQDNENELNAQAFPTLLGQENDRVHIRLRHDRAVESQPRLVGFTFGLGSYMNQEDF